MIHSREKDFSVFTASPVHNRTNLSEEESYYLYMAIAKHQQLIIRKRESKKHMYNPVTVDRLYQLEAKVREWIRLLAEQQSEEATS